MPRAQNRLQSRRCPVLLPGELFRQDAHDLCVNLIAGGNHVFAHRLFERQSPRDVLQIETQKSRWPDGCTEGEDRERRF